MVRIITVVFAMMCTAMAQRAASITNQNAGCEPAVRSTVPTKNQSVPREIRPLIPDSAYVRLVLPLSSTDTLTIYELGNWGRHWEKFEAHQEGGELTDPDSRLLITRQGKPVFRYALKDRPEWKSDEWGATLEAMRVVHQCSDNLDVTYVVLQSGNQGGFYLSLHRSDELYKLVPISQATQGRLVLHQKNPLQVDVWSGADTGVCTACAKPFIVKRLKFDGVKYRVVSKRKTRKSYGGFQDEPLLMNP